MWYIHPVQTGKRNEAKTQQPALPTAAAATSGKLNPVGRTHRRFYVEERGESRQAGRQASRLIGSECESLARRVRSQIPSGSACGVVAIAST